MQGRERQRALTRSVWGGQWRDTVTGRHNQIRNNTHEITRSENQSGQTWPDTAWPRINVPVSRNVWCPRAGVTVHCVYVNICYHRSHSRHEVMAMSHVLPWSPWPHIASHPHHTRHLSPLNSLLNSSIVISRSQPALPVSRPCPSSPNSVSFLLASPL